MGTKRPFRFGLINEQMTTRAAWIDAATRAEGLGFATFLVRDHFVPDFFGDQFGPVAALMSAADATSVLRIGTLVFDNDYRHPVILAKEAATLDLLSDGRLEFGIGAGWLEREYAVAGLPYDRPGVRIDRFAEGLAVMKGLWGDGPFTFQGHHYRLNAVEGYPKPVQCPNPPVLIGAGQPRMLRLAGREADIVGILTTSDATGTVVDVPTGRMWHTVEQQLGYVREGAGDRFDQIELSTVATVIVTNDRRTQTEALIRANEWQGVTVEDVWRMPAVYIGSTDQIVADLLERRERLGFSYVVVASARVNDVAPIVNRLAGT